jgi:quercetin dioxygenase-like cupin family protein
MPLEGIAGGQNVGFTGRRVVTGHTQDGQSTVLFDSILPLLGGEDEAGKESRQGATSRVFWTTEALPVDNNGTADAARQDVPTALADGSVLRIVQYAPGVMPRSHRTSSIDYVAILSGSIEVKLDTQTITLNTGDTLIQRGTIHNWINNGSEPCTILFAMVGAKPITADGETLLAQG